MDKPCAAASCDDAIFTQARTCEPATNAIYRLANMGMLFHIICAHAFGWGGQAFDAVFVARARDIPCDQVSMHRLN